MKWRVISNQTSTAYKQVVLTTVCSIANVCVELPTYDKKAVTGSHFPPEMNDLWKKH